MDDRARPTWVLVVFITAQILIPTVGLVLRWSGWAEYSRFGWQMFTVAP